MGDITLHAQAPVTVKQVKKYLQDQGYPADDWDLLKMHINGVTGLMLQFMGRKQMVHTADVQLTEYYRGYGESCIYLKNAPIQDLVSVTLLPHTSPIVITGPGTALSNDDMWFDAERGLINLKSRIFPDSAQAAKVIYESGFSAGDHRLENLMLIAMDAVAAKWKRWKDQKHGIASETKDNSSVTYSETDFSKTTIEELKAHRRTMFV